METYFALSFVGWLLGLLLNLGIRLDYPQQDPTHTAVGKSVLWPLFCLKFLLLSLYAGGKALFGFDQ